ncbi:MAG: hypothetical protein KAW03_10290, partial [Candidatus Lokiarchaeota archaeon]|nr:hypothetical protein [Candidatus Lokiarchaeota archaeon]
MITNEPASISATQVEENVEVDEIRAQIDQIISKSTEEEPITVEAKKIYQDGLKIPVNNTLITNELYSEVEKNKSFAYYDELSIFFTALNCVFLTKTNPQKYPKFSAFLKDFKMDVFTSKEISAVRKYYSKVLKRVKV